MPTPTSSQEIRKKLEEPVDQEAEIELCLILAKLYDTVDISCPPHSNIVT